MRNKKRKGFTLIELLAVIIIILAVIALIAIPVITNIINKARKSAAIDSAYAVLEAGRLYYTTSLLEHSNDDFTQIFISFNDGEYSVCEGSNLIRCVDTDDSAKIAMFSLKGTKPDFGSIKIETNGNVTIWGSLTISGYELIQDENGAIIYVEPSSEPLPEGDDMASEMH